MDIYFRPEYGKLCERIEGGTCECYEYNSSFGCVRSMFIKRPIPQLIDGVQYFDLITPYGYGGPLVLTAQDEFREKLCQDFSIVFAQYCLKNHIISEFVRFHPIKNNARDFSDTYNAVCIQKTLGTNLAAYSDPVQTEFSKNCQKNIRRSLQAGLTYRINEAPDQIDSFLNIYYSTMDRNHASEFYYFDKAYFDEMLCLLKGNLLFVEVMYDEIVIAASLCFISDGLIHIHLSGTLSEYLSFSPSYVLRYAIVVWGKMKGYQMIHHGGGTSNLSDNPLFRFKKQFAQNTEFDYYVGKKIWNKEIYKMLCKDVDVTKVNDFFPAYRKR
jgi:hypothetical protein